MVGVLLFINIEIPTEMALANAFLSSLNCYCARLICIFSNRKHTRIRDMLNYYVELGSGDEHNAQAYRA